MSTNQTTAGSDEQTREFQDRYNLHDIKLLDGEQILDVTSDHFTRVFSALFVPAMVAIISIGVAIFRGMGGEFLVPGAETSRSAFDVINGFLIAFLVLLILVWLMRPIELVKGKLNTVVMGLIALAVAGLIFFRASGGSVFYMDTMQNGSFFDIANIILLIIGAIGIGFSIYTYIECENDHLILTNNRVILYDRRVWGPYQIEQVMLRDIQDVTSQTDSYFQHYLQFGTVEVQSVRKSLKFKGAERAKNVQENIMAQVKSLKGERKNENLRELIDTKLYGKQAPAPPPKVRIRLSSNPRLLSWLLPDNPQVNEQDGTILWRPHWLFLLQTLVIPVVFLLVAFVVIIAAARFPGSAPLLSGAWLIMAVLATLIVFFGWSAYRIEDHLNDHYILKPTEIIDIEKKPWGPENKRSARLDAIQDVTNNTSLIGRMFRYGDVFVQTAGKGEFTFHNVPYPDEVVQAINEYQGEYRASDTKRSLDQIADLLKLYHEDQPQGREAAPLANTAGRTTQQL